MFLFINKNDLMKYLLVDEGTNLILTYSEDPRIVTNLKRAIFDSEVHTIFPHYEIYNSITDSNIQSNHLTLDRNSFSLILPNDIDSALLVKKDLSVFKRRLISIIFGIIKRTISSYSYFIDPIISDLLDDSAMLQCYMDHREYKFNGIEKDIQTRKETYKITMIKLQACVDDFLDQVIKSNNRQELVQLEIDIKMRML